MTDKESSDLTPPRVEGYHARRLADPMPGGLLMHGDRIIREFPGLSGFDEACLAVADLLAEAPARPRPLDAWEPDGTSGIVPPPAEPAPGPWVRPADLPVRDPDLARRFGPDPGESPEGP